MGNKPKNASERQFQEDFVQRMTRYRWKAPDFLNGNQHTVTVQTLIANWRQELNRLNADQLEGVQLTDAEFSQVMAKVNQIADSYEAAKLLAMENSTGKIDGILRDKLPGVTRKQITLTIFRKAAVGGGDSTYQIAREVQTASSNRFDVVLLINGLPLINIEMKSADVPLAEAFAQFRRYYEAGEYVHNFMAFSQMMVVMSRTETRYFATPRNSKGFNESFVFHWADHENHPMNDWRNIVDNFLKIPMAHQMVGDYAVIDEADREEDRLLMLMRPYQVYALQSVELAAFGRDNEDNFAHGGYVWHTTGSGKTITSFKTALFLSTRAGFDKIVFMVDRRELDKNTTQRFQAYAAYEPVVVDATPSTAALSSSMKHSGIVVTTTFKMNELVKKLIENGDSSLAEKNIVFIIDEAHRTTMGGMMKTIKDYFRKNGLFYGFTGTPLFDEKHVRGRIDEKSELIKTTEDLFGPLLHAYTIEQAIADRNVLGFHVQYVNTGEFQIYDALREQLVDVLAAQPAATETTDELEELVAGWSDAKVESEAEKNGLLAYQDETHIPIVVKRMLSGWETQSQGRTFNAILTVAYKKRVLDYYKEFQRQLAGAEHPIHVAMTVSFGSPNAPDRLPKEFIEEMFRDYAAFTGVSFVAGDQRRGEDAYFADLAVRGQRGGSGRNPKNIDLIIVADQMLTGWDDKYLNTLYNDRMLELQGLIQAYSRTNRVLSARKEFGTIINYLRPAQTQEAVDEALRLYCKGGENAHVIVEPYDTAVLKFAVNVEAMRDTLPDPTAWAELVSDDVARDAFLKAFRSAAKQLRCLEQYYEFAWDAERFTIDEKAWLNYVGAYKNLRPKTEEPEDEIIRPLPGRAKIIGGTQVTASYILSLVGEKTRVVNGIRVIDSESLRLILEKIKELENLGNKQQADTLNEFVGDLQNGNIPAGNDTEGAFSTWKHHRYTAAVQAFATAWGVQPSLLESAIKLYDETAPGTIPRLDDIRDTLDYESAMEKHGDYFDHGCELEDRLPEWIREVREIYLD